MQSGTLPAPALIAAGITAGVAGAIFIDAYLIVVLVYVLHSTNIAGLYEYVASGAIGQAAYATANAAYLGAVLHVVVSLTWAIGYAYVAARTPQVLQRPLLSGVAFGFVVMVAMQLVEVAAGIYRQPTTLSLGNEIVAHTVFFGIPVAYVVTRRLAGATRRRVGADAGR
jgi:uncharacterized membrane protein YagU involved in acid resistance